MQEILSYELFHGDGFVFTIAQLALSFILVFLLFALYRLVLKRYFPKVFELSEITEEEKGKLSRLFRGLAILLFILFMFLILNINPDIPLSERFSINPLTIIRAGIFFQIARMLGWLLTNVFIHGYYNDNKAMTSVQQEMEEEQSETSVRKTLQYTIYIIIAIYVLTSFGWDMTLFERTINGNTFTFKISNILRAILIFLGAKLFFWAFTRIFLKRVYGSRGMEVGSQFAINQLVKYVIYVFAIVMALEVFGINMNILLGGAAALLVGIGLGLQQTFNDFISGLVLLFERSVSVGDVLEVDGQVGRIKEIGLRSTTMETRGNINLVVPNHKLVNEKVTNWNHYNDKVRFQINVGVAYGSDTAQVKKILLQAVKDNPYVLDYPAPFVRFETFGSSSLDFSLYFFSRNLMVIEDVKSDIRLEIDRLFRKNGIEIPFPQRVIRRVD